jgi:dTDP-4-dehydrorhamnose reductase
MLGQALMTTGITRGLQIVGAARTDAERILNLEDANSLVSLIADVKPSIIINAAAATDLHACEQNPGQAYLLNARCVSVLSEAAQKCGAWLIQVSTDHYYTGDRSMPHTEESPVQLVNEYARSKYAGERFSLTCPGALVVRTNIVGFRNRGAPTFVEWIINELAHGRTIPAFDDYFVSSIAVKQFAAALFDLLSVRPAGILNLAASEIFSKRQFIEALRNDLMNGEGQIEPASVRILSGAQRAESLGLNVSRAERLLGRTLPTLSGVVKNLATEYQERKACVTTA